MGFNYRRRPRAQKLNVTSNDLIGYSLSEHNIDFSKHDYEDVAVVVNKKLDKAEQRLKELFSNE